MKDSNISENTDPKRDIFTDPALGREASDPVGEFIKGQWRPLLIAVILAFSVVYVRDAFRESKQRSLAEGANALFESQEALKNYREAIKKVNGLKEKKDPSDADKKELETAQEELKGREERMNQTLQILGESAAPYGKFAPIVSGLAAYERNDLPKVRSDLERYNPERLSDLNGQDRVVAELGLLTLARALLDFPEAEIQARGILVALAQKGETAAVSAALTLSHIAVTEQDRQQAREIATALAERFPEQATVLKE